jgi:putative ABC transport system ATP-binding protein
MIQISGLTCLRGSVTDGFRLEVPSLRLPTGSALAVTGPSGCGKSTLLDLLGLVLRPGSAETFRLGGAGGTDIAALWSHGSLDELARARASGIGYVLQTGGLLPFLSVRDNIALSLDLLGLRASPHVGELVDILGLRRLLDKKPKALSIGERQRVAIARALAHQPPLMLADEPTSSLDPATSEAVLDLLLRVVRQLGTTLVVVSHDWDLLARFGLRRLEAIRVDGAGPPTTRFEE